MKTDICYIPVTTLHNFIKDVFITSGVKPEEAIICADVLITSDLRGIESHGIGRLKMYYDRIKSGRINPSTNFQVVNESPTTAVIDANHSLGMITGTKAMQLAINKAKKMGLGAVAVRNSTHFGIDGYYPLMAVKENMIGMSFTNARPAIAPTFGVKPMLGTNPIAFGAPSDEEFPFLFDAATSITQRGKIEVLNRENKPVPEGLVIDENNTPYTKPQAILDDLLLQKAALLPLGGVGEELAGYKGYGLATIVEILCASLQDGKFLYGLSGFDNEGNDTELHRLGHFFLAINISYFIPIDTFKSITGNILRELRNANKAPGESRIYTAGEKEYEKELFVNKNGVPVLPKLQEDIKQLQKELKLDQYHFSF